MTFLAEPGLVVMTTTQGQIPLSEERVNRKLDDYQRVHDDLLRTGKPDDRLAARRVRALWNELYEAGQSAFEPSGIPVLQPITLRVAKTDWCAV